MRKLKLRRWDPARHLHDEADIAVYLDAALQEEDPELLVAVLRDIARARRRLKIAGS